MASSGVGRSPNVAVKSCAKRLCITQLEPRELDSYRRFVGGKAFRWWESGESSNAEVPSGRVHVSQRRVPVNEISQSWHRRAGTSATIGVPQSFSA